MVPDIFHWGSINLIKSLSTGEITIFLTFRERIIISFKEIWLVGNVESEERLQKVRGDKVFINV